MPDNGRSLWLSLFLLWGVLSIPALAAVSPEQLEITTKAILCDCGCHPQSVHECACGRADEMETMIADRMEREGLDGEAMLKLWIDEHGEASLLVPKARGFSLVAWLGPILALPLALLGLYLVLKRSHGKSEDDDDDRSDPTQTRAELDPASLERLRLAREEWDQ